MLKAIKSFVSISSLKRRCNKLKTFFLTLLISTSANLALAGKVRSLRATDNEMVPIHLKIGRSTVIRFREKPQKVVVGNQNYFNIEFIGKDVTLQPQAIVTSNLFIYTKNHTYGFLLKVGEQGEYDDLVKVKWKSSRRPLQLKKPKTKPTNNPIHLALKDRLLLKVEKIAQTNKNQQLYFMEVLLKNISLQKMKLPAVKIFLTNSEGKRLQSQVFFLNKSIQKGSIAKGRVLFHVKELKDLFLYLGNENSLSRILIPRCFFANRSHLANKCGVL